MTDGWKISRKLAHQLQEICEKLGETQANSAIEERLFNMEVCGAGFLLVSLRLIGCEALLDTNAC